MHIDNENGCGRFSATGRVMPEQAAEIAAGALTAARAERATTLILDFRNLSLTRPMSITECHHFGQRLAQAGAGLLKLAVVASEECRAPCGFVFTVASNRGLTTAGFDHESEAMRWLSL